MRKFIAIILAVVAAQVVSAQSAATPEPTTSYCGNIGRSDGAAITGALVSMRHLAKGHMHQSKSGPDGKYCVNGLAVGKYGLTVSYRGFRIAYTTVKVSLDSTIAANTTLIEAPDSFGDLTIKIADITAELADAVIRVIDSDGNVILTNANEDGTISAENLEKGRYTVIIDVNGKATKVGDIKIRPNRTTVKSVDLERREQ